MSHGTNLSFLDHPEILEIVFPIVHSPLFSLMTASSQPTPDAATRFIEVEKGIRIGCGFWPVGKEYPSIIYFYGNGEIAGNYEFIAPYYNQKNINLFVSDYRGYGLSDGKPTITNLIQDAHPMWQGFKNIIKEEGYTGQYFLMGRSLGSIPALEIAFHYQDDIQGLIIDSGTASNFHRLWSYLKRSEQDIIENGNFLNKVKLRSVHQPTLIIQGSNDQIIPLQEGQELFENSGASEKIFFIVPGADHNDIMMVRQKEYFNAIEDFVTAHSDSHPTQE
ncbi:alpha/beta hydrolase [Chloroflexota bacterium]